LRLPSPLCSGSRGIHRASSLLLDAPFSPRLPLGSRGPVAEVSRTGLGVAKQRRRSHAPGRARAPLVLLVRRWKAQGWLRRAPPCGAAGRLLRSSPVEKGVTRRSRATTTDLTRRRAVADERACATRLWWLGRPPCDWCACRAMWSSCGGWRRGSVVLVAGSLLLSSRRHSLPSLRRRPGLVVPLFFSGSTRRRAGQMRGRMRGCDGSGMSAVEGAPPLRGGAPFPSGGDLELEQREGGERRGLAPA
jgi:hypothetical protein